MTYVCQYWYVRTYVYKCMCIRTYVYVYKCVYVRTVRMYLQYVLCVYIGVL